MNSSVCEEKWRRGEGGWQSSTTQGKHCGTTKEASSCQSGM